MANPDPQDQVVFNAVAYSTTADNTSAVINVPEWATKITLLLNATHAGTLDTVASNRSLSATNFEFDSARATTAGANAFIYEFYVPRITFRWASGTAAAGTLNASVVFTKGPSR